MRIAVFPGSFDPITNAHIDIIERALPLFDKIHIALGVNSNKKYLLPLESRKAILQKIFKDEAKITIDDYEGLTIDYCQRNDANYILRGIRSVSDFEFEQPISQNNQIIDSSIQTIFLISSPGFSHISSTIVREIYQYKGDISKLVPKEVIEKMPSK
jgi:pantetheine-phosphate adenylyltransferase